MTVNSEVLDSNVFVRRRCCSYCLSRDAYLHLLFFFLFWLLHNAIQKHTRKDKRSYSLSKRIKCMHVDIAACSMETRMNVVSLCYDCCMNLLIYYVKY